METNLKENVMSIHKKLMQARLKLQDTHLTKSGHNKFAGYKFIEFKCPMSTAALKGCHDVQNLGAVLTYIRRYLWVNAFEIVESDAVDASAGAATFKMKDTKSEDFI